MMKIAPLIAVLLLAACGGPDQAAEGERQTAAGEVLGGTISDDMLPLDTVTSQSPPLRDDAGADGADSTAGATARPRADDGGPGEPPRDPAPAPAQSTVAPPPDDTAEEPAE